MTPRPLLPVWCDDSGKIASTCCRHILTVRCYQVLLYLILCFGFQFELIGHMSCPVWLGTFARLGAWNKGMKKWSTYKQKSWVKWDVCTLREWLQLHWATTEPQGFILYNKWGTGSASLRRRFPVCENSPVSSSSGCYHLHTLPAFKIGPEEDFANSESDFYGEGFADFPLAWNISPWHGCDHIENTYSLKEFLDS